MNGKTSSIFTSPLFLSGLFLLLLNDFYLKAEFHNTLTGKLSDFAGLFIFPLFFVAFFQKRKVIIYILTGTFFIYWKSPLSQNLIDGWNSLNISQIGRTIDYTDLIALTILPLSYLCFLSRIEKPFTVDFTKRIFASLIISISVFAFTATSFADDRTLYFEEEYIFTLSHSQIESILQQNPNLKYLKLERETEVFGNNPNVEKDPNTFYAKVSITKQICDTSLPEFSFVILDKKGFSVIKIVSARVRCQAFAEGNSNTAIKEYTPEANAIFQREVIEFLKQNRPQQ